MLIVDSGFLYALVDQRDAWHQRAKALTGTAAEGWITTWPVLTEVCHLYQRRLGVAPAIDLMGDVADGGIQVWSPDGGMLVDLPLLMKRYAQLPMDLADASLVLLAGHLGHGRILSTDERDFETYRWKRHHPFNNLLAAEPA